MVNENSKILINKFLDDELTPDEKTLLDKELTEDAELMKYFEEMLLVEKLLKTEAKNTQSIDFSNQIISKIETLNQKSLEINKIKHIQGPRILKSIRFRLAFAFITGAAACFILLLSIFDFGNNDKQLLIENLSGAMISQSSSSDASKILTSQQATVEIHQSKLQEGFIQFDVSQTSTELINVVFSFNAGNFKVFGLRPVEQGTNSSIGATLNSVVIKSSGNDRFVFLLKQMNQLESNINIKVYSENGTILNDEIFNF